MTDRVLVVNAGSSTLKLRILGAGDTVEASCDVDPWHGDADPSILDPLGDALGTVDAVGYRVVHGGGDLREPTLVDDATVAAIEALTPLAPLHQPRAVAAIRAVRAAMPDLREIPAGSLAVDVYLHRLRREIAGMVAALGGLDVLVFTGGVGEHQPGVRAEAAAGLSFLGIALDAEANAATTGDGEISSDGAAVRTVVVTSREDVEIARQVRQSV